MQPDYSRQMLLKEIGAEGQAALGRARVLIVGAGGLGSPVLQYLAGAGVGCLGLVDGDVLDASNLHRQPIYALEEVGRRKIDLAAAAVRKINPAVRIEPHAMRLDADNAVELIGRYDLVIDCSDNFRTHYLVNDAAVLSARPAIFASVYQYEGQLQLYKPTAGFACLRCLWPDAVADGVVGNCAEAGVLGPVPGAFGAMQALLALKVLLGMGGQLEGELLLVDFMNFSSYKLKARRRSECHAPACAHIHRIHPEEQDLEIELESLAAAANLGLEIVDIRDEDEIAARPSAARHIAMPALLADPGLLLRTAQTAGSAAQREFLLICASGRRSLAAARELRRRGINARSLSGGLQKLGS